MKKILFIFMLLGMVQSIMAQPAARRKQAQQKAQQSNADNMTLRAKLYFPTAIPMDEDVVWRRDIYRELNLTDDANAALYYPVEPTDGKMNLFTYIFKLMFTGRVPVYQYRMDGNEDFSAANRLTPKAFVDNYHIYYEKTDNGKVHIDDSDIPSAEVKAYYVKETSYYDQKTASFHTKVLALCPIMTRNDDFGDVGNKYPLFWVKYDDLAPFLAKQQLMTSNVNNAAVMSAEDYFTKNLYQGKIYKTNNMQGNTLAQYCPSDTAMAAASKLKPTIGIVTFTIGPTKKPVLLDASNTSLLKDMLVTSKPPFKPNLIWALAFVANIMAATTINTDKTFFILYLL